VRRKIELILIRILDNCAEVVYDVTRKLEERNKRRGNARNGNETDRS
jgi:hypothetical protein